ncbi:CrcB family protein [Leifsonia sp. F6_8S_P_1B]|uniref:Fluoride-specific ion channel FluC n=1 Tax=Leifsonia williamsii TaxID=3035919 RepID=A0ABT8K814_9MICO|nr:CrcB family protein [Leifsonia williamsii]MDN4613581.1 CrcB family protein [Leifsonia williamsii]
MHLHWRSVLLVFVGGAIGTTVRYLLSLAVPPVLGLPLITLVINVTGAFVLGWLLEALALRGPDEGRRRDLRLFAGTGILGGYTTYSAFAVDTDGLLVAANVGGGLLYAAATIVIGAAATVAGIAAAAWFGRRRARRQGGAA